MVEERFNWTVLEPEGKEVGEKNIWERKTFGRGKHLGRENIWGMKTFEKGKHLGEERFNWTSEGKEFGK